MLAKPLPARFHKHLEGVFEMPRICFFLPGRARRPVGGYKVVYEYANYLSKSLSADYEVHIFEASGLADEFSDQHARNMRALRRPGKAFLNKWQQVKGRSWYTLEPEVVVHVTTGLPTFEPERGDILIATAARTVPFVVSACERGARGVYFIQHFEDWAVPYDDVVSTWRSGLALIVIAPWLADVGDSLGVSTKLVPNAVDTTEFPPGLDLKERENLVLAMVSPIAFKRTDLIVDLYHELVERNPAIRLATFGVCDRPVGLPAAVEHFKRPSRSELSSLYRQAQVYVCAADAEGWHLPASEALSSGCMVVSTDVGGVRAYAEGVALFSPTGSVGGLIENVESVLRDPAEFQHRVDEGKDRLRRYGPLDAARAFAEAIGVDEGSLGRGV